MPRFTRLVRASRYRASQSTKQRANADKRQDWPLSTPFRPIRFLLSPTRRVSPSNVSRERERERRRRGGVPVLSTRISRLSSRMRVSPSRSVFGHPAQGQRDTLSARQAPARNSRGHHGAWKWVRMSCVISFWDFCASRSRVTEGAGGQRYAVERRNCVRERRSLYTGCPLNLLS